MRNTVARPEDRPAAGSVRRPSAGRRLTSGAVLLCLALTTLGVLAGLWASGQQAGETREAQAAVLLRPLEGNAFNPSTSGADLINMETEAQLVSSSVVTALAAERLGAPVDAEDLRSGLGVAVPPNTQLIEITAKGADGQEAVDRTQALAETFLAFRADRSESDIFDRSARLQEEIRTREAERRQIVGNLGNEQPNAPQTVIREQRISELTTQLGEFRVQLAELEAASTDPGQVVTTAETTPPGLLGQPWLLPLLGGLFGLAVGALLLAGRRRMDERVHGPGDFDHSGVPVLGRLPLSADQRPRAVGGIRAAILAAERSRPLVVGIAAGTSSGAEIDGASTSDLTGELGLSLRRAGMAVAVLDLAAGPDTPVGRATGSADHEGSLLGLSELLGAEQDMSDVLARRRASGLPLAVVNDLADDELADRASSPEMASLLDAMRQVSDVVVVDIGSLGDTSAQSLVGVMDTVVLAVSERVGTFRELEASLERLPRWGGRLAGIVLVETGRGRRSEPGIATDSGHPADGQPPHRPEREAPKSTAEADTEPASAQRSRDGGAATRSSFLAREPR